MRSCARIKPVIPAVSFLLSIRLAPFISIEAPTGKDNEKDSLENDFTAILSFRVNL